MYSVNKRFFAGLVVVVVLAGVTVFLVHRFQSDRIAGALMWQAERAQEEDRPDKAARYLSSYLEFKPEDQEARLKLCKLMEKRAANARDWANVLAVYERVLRAEPGRDDVRRHVAGLCAMPQVARYSDGIDHADRVLANGADDGQLWETKGRCLAALNRHDEARQSFETAIAREPTRVTAYERLAYLLRKHLGDPKQAGEKIEAMVKANAGRAEAYLARAAYRRDIDPRADVEGDYLEALKLDEGNADALLGMAQVAQAKGKIDEARKYLARGCDAHPRDLRMVRNLAWIEVWTGNREQALARLEKAREVMPDEIELLTPIADLLLQKGEDARALAIIETLKSKKAPANQIDYLNARVAMRQQRYSEALEAFDRLRSTAVALPGLMAQVNLLSAECYHALGNADAEQDALQRVLAADPNHFGARASLGEVYLNAGRVADAVAELKQLVPLAIVPAAIETGLARQVVARVRNSKAFAEEWRAVTAAVELIARKHPDEPDTGLLKAEVLAAERKFDEARDALEAACAKAPTDARLWLSLSNCAEAADGSRAALAVLDRGEKAAGDTVEFRLARARLLVNDPSENAAAVLSKLELSQDRFDAADRVRLAYGLAGLYKRLKATAEAKRLYQTIVRARPGEVAARRSLFELALAENDQAAAVAMLDQIKAAEKDSRKVSVLLEARRWIDLAGRGDKSAADQAAGLLNDLVAKHPNNAEAYQLLGRLLESKGEKKDAVAHYRRAAELNPGDWASIHKQFVLLREEGPAEANLVVQKHRHTLIGSADGSDPLLEGVLPSLSDPFLDQLAAVTLADDPGDYRAQRRVGYLQWQRGKRSEAIKSFREAARLAPSVPENWLELVRALSLTGDIEAAKQAIDQASAALGDRVNPVKERLLVYAQQFERAREEARQNPGAGELDRLKKKVQLALMNKQKAEAREELERYVREKAASDKEGVRWARRHLATVLASENTSGEFLRAKEMLARNEAEAPAALEDQRAKVVVLSTPNRGLTVRERQKALAEAVELLAKLVRQPDATAQDRFTLARLRLQSGDWDGCRRDMAELVERDPGNRAYTHFYAGELLQRNLHDEAKPLVERLEKSDGKNLLSVALVMRYHLRDNPGRVYALAQAYRKNLDIDRATRDYPAQLFQTAVVLDQLVRLQLAEGKRPELKLVKLACDLYQQSPKDRPDVLVRHVSLLAAAGKTAAALEYLDKMYTVSPPAVALAGVSVLREGQPTPQQFEQVHGWLKGATEKVKNRPELHLAMAEYCSIKGDDKGAELSYREALKVDKQNLVALNNLAWLLAVDNDKQKVAEGLEFVKTAILKADGARGELLDTRGKLFLKSGQYDKAIDDLTDALAEAPTPQRYFHMAEALLKQGKTGEATEAFKKAREKGLNEKRVHPKELAEYKALLQQTGG